MFARSIASSLRQATARPPVAAGRVAAMNAAGSRSVSRAYSDKPSSSADAEGSADAATSPDAETAKKIADLEAKIAELNKEMQYARADYQTLSRRSAEERIKTQEFAISSFARALLSTTDVLATALHHVPKPLDPGTPLAEFYSGVELTRKALLQTFESHGVKPMEKPEGEQFDPNRHEAMFHIPAQVAPKRQDGAERIPGEVIEVSKDGWMIKDRVLRPAQVGVVQME